MEEPYSIKTIEVIDCLFITTLVPVAVFSLFFNLLAIVVLLRLRNHAHLRIITHLVVCDLLLAVCQAHTLKVLIQRRESETSISFRSIDYFCNISGYLFHSTITISWWLLSLACLVRMWHITMKKSTYAFTVSAIWSFGLILSLMPYLSNQVYRLSWTHAACLWDETSIFTLNKLSIGYNIIWGTVLVCQYGLPVLIALGSIAKDLYCGRERLRNGWTCTVMLFFTYCIFSIFWWVDIAGRNFTPTAYPINTATIIRRTGGLMVLYLKPLAAFFCLYHFLEEFRSSLLRLVRLEFSKNLDNAPGPHYERMYSEIDDRLSPGSSI